MSTRQYRSKFR